MPFEPFDYNEVTSYQIRKIVIKEYQPTKPKPWRQVKPEPSFDLIFNEPRSEILVKLRLAIILNNPQPAIIGAAIAFPPQFWQDLWERKQQDRDYLSCRVKEWEAEKQRKRNEGPSTSQDPRKTPDQ